MNCRCPICDCTDSDFVYGTPRQPLLLNHLLASRTQAHAAPSGDLRFYGCCNCGFVWNAAFEPRAIQYKPGYVNDQSHSAVFRSHLRDVMNRLAHHVADVEGAIVEIGCGQGAFLRDLCVMTGRTGIGFDPACDERLTGQDRIVIHSEPFGSASTALLARQPISLICCRHVLEHLADPASMVRTIAGLMRSNPNTRLYLEVPAFEWIAQQAAFFDLFYEHCSLFDAGSMRRMLQGAGFESIQIAHVFGGQYLAAEARLSGNASANAPAASCLFDFHDIATALVAQRQHWSDRIAATLRSGPLMVWGAGAKGVSLVNQLGLSHERVLFLIDMNPAKQGRFVPLTGQRVIGPHQLPELIAGASATSVILVMNPNYADEIARLLNELDMEAAIEVMSGSDRVEVHC